MSGKDARLNRSVRIKERHTGDVRRTCGPDALGHYVGRGGMLIPDITLLVTQTGVVAGVGTGRRVLVRFPRDIELWIDLEFVEAV